MFSRVHLARLAAIAILFPALTLAAPPAPQGDAAYWDGYHKTMSQLRAGQWNEALATLNAMDKVTRGDGRILLTRGIVKTLQGDYNGAHSDLERVRLENTREPLLWQNIVDCMSGDVRGGRGIPLPRSLQKPGQPTHSFSGIPGHLVQGGKDYPTSYGSFVVYDMAWPHYLAREESKPFDAKAMQETKVQAGRWYANRMLATQEMSSRNFAWAQALMKKGEFREAREILDFAQAPYPFDPDMAATSGDIWLAAGRPDAARRDYTIALTFNTMIAGAYAGRAQAAAMMGDARRANADVALAKSYGADIAALAPRVTQLLALSSASGDAWTLLDEMDKAAAAGATVEALLPRADRLHRVMNNQRVRYDELYQETIRAKEYAIANTGKAIDARLDLAQYLLDELDSRGETVEPRRGRVGYRWQYSRAMELNRASFHVEKALAQDGKHPHALILKATVLGEQGQDDAASRVIDDAMKIAGSDPRAVRLLAEFRRKQIARMFRQASALRTPSFSSTSHDEHRSDGVWRVTTTTRYDPSGADLARAAALEAAAKQLIAQTRGIMESALRASEGNIDDYLLLSAYENWFGTGARALAALQQAVAKYPKDVRGHDALVDYLRLLGRRDEALEAEAVALQLTHTSCGPLLTRAWNNVDRQGFGPLVDVLTRARKLDPTDVRATIYLAEAERDLQDKEKSAALFAVAAALETARLNIDEQAEGKAWPRRADDMAALMASRIMLAKAAALYKRDNEQIAHLEAAIALAQRYPPDGRKTPMFGAVFLGANAKKIPMPETPNGARLAADALLEAGRWYQARNRMADAKRCFEASTALGVHPRNDPFPGRSPPRPNVGTTDPKDNNYNDRAGAPSAEAAIELAKIEIGKKNYKAAFELLNAATQAPDLSRERRREINDLILEVLPKLNE